MKKNNNRGFSLVELIVAIAIASFVILAGGRLLSTILKQYSKDNYDIKLQTEVEEMTNLLENWVMDAVKVEISEDMKTLTVTKIKEGETGLFTSSVYESGNKLYYVNQAGKPIYLGNFVESVSFNKTQSESAVYVTLNMKYGSSNYTTSRKIILRNAPEGAGTGALGTGNISKPSTPSVTPQPPEPGPSEPEMPADPTTEPSTESVVNPQPSEPTTTTEEETTTEQQTAAPEPQETNPEDNANKDDPELVADSNYSINSNGSTHSFQYFIKNNKPSKGDWYYAKARFYYLYKGERVGLVPNVSNNVDGVTFSMVDVPLETYVAGETKFQFGYFELSSQSVKTIYYDWNNIQFSVVANNIEFVKAFNGNNFYPVNINVPENVCLYYKDEKVFGDIPQCNDVLFDVVRNDTEINGDKATVTLEIEKQGMGINWDSLELQYYFEENDENITVENVTVSSSEHAPKSASCTVNHTTDTTMNYVGANSSVSIAFGDDDIEYDYIERITVSFTISGSLDITNSFSYNNVDNVRGIYSGATPKEFGKQPTEKKPVEVGAEVDSSPQTGVYYHKDKPIKQIIIEYEEIEDNGYGNGVVLYGNNRIDIRGVQGQEQPITINIGSDNNEYIYKVKYEVYYNLRIKSVVYIYADSVEIDYNNDVITDPKQNTCYYRAKPIKKVKIKYKLKQSWGNVYINGQGAINWDETSLTEKEYVLPGWNGDVYEVTFSTQEADLYSVEFIY